ncbi:hypothetical protein NK326_24465, partial [Salmonella enterica]|nr:hypothetical protein [Salmonella enterica]
WFGWQALPALVLVSSVVGLVYGLAKIALRRHDRDTPFPFGPFIAGAGLLVLFAGADWLLPSLAPDIAIEAGAMQNH